MMTKDDHKLYSLRLSAVLDLLDQNKGKHKEIARTKGIKYTTLSKIAQRVTKNPTQKIVESISDYFHGF